MTALKQTQSSQISDPYIPQDDVSVAKRLAEAQGFGEPMYYEDVELSGVIQDFGIRDQ